MRKLCCWLFLILGILVPQTLPTLLLDRLWTQHPFRNDPPSSYSSDRLASPSGAGTKTAPPLRNYQLAHPPVVPRDGTACEVLLLRHAFGNSYWRPAIVNYTPPTGCGSPAQWAAVVLNFTVTANGTQFDRLGSISLNHVEIWRTSTAEPTQNGIIWTALKDVTRFIPLFSEPSTLMFDENNLLTERYTGIFDTTLTATFYKETKTFPAPPTADAILALGTESTTQSQMLTYPGPTGRGIRIPVNTAEAVVEILATGNAVEEFWYTNVPDEFQPYVDDELPAKGPFREVQLLIDDQLAGVVSPFPVLYTGGANPLLWRPLASLRAFDIPSFFIDITTFLPLLTDDALHTFSFIVLGQGRGDLSVNENWFITGAIHLRLDQTVPPVRTTGHIISYDAAPHATISTIGEISEGNSSITAWVTASRTLRISSLVRTGSDFKVVTFSQEIEFANAQKFTDNGAVVKQTCEISSTITHDGSVVAFDLSSFPLTISTNYSSYPSSFSASFGPYAYNRVLKLPAFLGLRTETTNASQTGEATLARNSDGRSYVGASRTREAYVFADVVGNTFEQHMEAANSTVISNKSSGTLAGFLALFAPSREGTEYPVETVDGAPFIEGLAFRKSRPPSDDRQ